MIWAPVAAIRDAGWADASGGVMDHLLPFYLAVFGCGGLFEVVALALILRQRARR